MIAQPADLDTQGCSTVTTGLHLLPDIGTEIAQPDCNKLLRRLPAFRTDSLADVR